MKEIGILFQADMVRAILACRKTLTSRLRGMEKINERPEAWRYQGVTARGDHRFFNAYAAHDFSRTLRSPYGQAGDVLIGRETFYCDDYRFPDIPESDQTDPDWRNQMLYYRADGDDLCQQIPECDCSEAKGRWHPSIHMPYWASRLRLPVVKVWSSRLHDMTEEMAKQEGVEQLKPGFWKAYNCKDGFCVTALRSYETLWDRINSKSYPWANNPSVWRVQFSKLP